MMLVSSASVCFCTSADPRARILSDLPMGVWPLPSGPWHMAHLALKIPAPSGVASARSGVASSARITRIIVVFMGSFFSFSFQSGSGRKTAASPFLESSTQDARVAHAPVLEDLHGLARRLLA